MASESERIVVIAIDGSDTARKAFNWYLDHLTRKGDKVYLVTVGDISQKVDMGFLPGHFSEEKIQKIVQQAKEEGERIDVMLNEYMAELRSKGIHGEARHLPGREIGPIILEFAKENKAAMICVGTRGQGTMRRTFMGSVSDYILHHAETPIIVVR